MAHMDSAQPLGIGLIGLGRHGMRYARHLAQDIPEARLVAACRRNVARGFELPTPEPVKLHGDYRSVIRDPSVHALIVVTPPVLTPAICEEAAAAGKPLLIEKPLAATAAGARRMVESARKAGVVLMTAQTLRFDPTILAMKETWPRVGTPWHLSLACRVETKTTPLSSAEEFGMRGVLLELGVHLFDQVRFLTGEEAVEIRCLLDRIPPAAPERVAAVQVRTSGGLLCVIEVARVTVGRTGRIECVGSQGFLEADWYRRRLACATEQADPTEWSIPPQPTIIPTIRAFLRAVRTKLPPPITGEDGLKAVEMAEACYRSAEQDGRPVRVHQDR